MQKLEPAAGRGTAFSKCKWRTLPSTGLGIGGGCNSVSCVVWSRRARGSYVRPCRWSARGVGFSRSAFTVVPFGLFVGPRPAEGGRGGLSPLFLVSRSVSIFGRSATSVASHRHPCSALCPVGRIPNSAKECDVQSAIMHFLNIAPPILFMQTSRPTNRIPKTRRF